MSELTRFQDAFTAGLSGDGAALAPWLGAGGGIALAVYRNTSAKGATDALVANYSTVAALVGEDWLRGAASAFVAEHPPERPSLLDYGSAFPAWLGRFPPAAALPYLEGIARIDRLWTEAHLAAEAEALDPAVLAAMPPEALACTTVGLHPSARLCAFDHNTAALWLRNRYSPPDEAAFDWRPGFEALALVRVEGAVVARLLSAAAFAFFAALAAGRPLADAAAQAGAAEPDVDLAAILSAGLRDSLFTKLNPVGETCP